MTKSILHLVFAALLLTLPLSACGVKPNSVEPPQGEESDQFPRHYPPPSEH